MSRPQAHSAIAQHPLDVERATGVGAGEELCLRGQHVLCLAVTDLGCALGLEQVVDAAAAAALIGIWHLDELEAGDGSQDRSRLFLQPLGVAEVTR